LFTTNPQITGCSINPTRSFGPSLVAGSWDKHWIWWVAPIFGATLAVGAWRIMHVGEADAGGEDGSGAASEGAAAAAAKTASSSSALTTTHITVSGNATGTFNIMGGGGDSSRLKTPVADVAAAADDGADGGVKSMEIEVKKEDEE
jgi:hypothetical protein